MPSTASASPQRSPGKSQPRGPQGSGDGQGKKRCLPFTKGPQSIQSCDSWWGAFWDASFVPYSTKNYAFGVKNEGSWNCHLRMGTSWGNFDCIVWCHDFCCLFLFFWRTEVTNKTPPSSKKIQHIHQTRQTYPASACACCSRGFKALSEALTAPDSRVLMGCCIFSGEKNPAQLI